MLLFLINCKKYGTIFVNIENLVKLIIKIKFGDNYFRWFLTAENFVIS